MGLDIRVPIGLLFLVFGVALILWGAAGEVTATRAAIAGSANVWWGGVMSSFGAAMLWLGRRTGRQ